MTTKTAVKTAEPISETLIIAYRRGEFVVDGREEAVLTLEEIGKLAAKQAHPFLTNTEAAAIVKFAGRIMTAIRYQGGVR